MRTINLTRENILLEHCWDQPEPHKFDLSSQDRKDFEDGRACLAYRAMPGYPVRTFTMDVETKKVLVRDEP